MQKELSREYLHNEYVVNKRSIYDIAQDFNTYPNKILRALHKYHLPIRDKSEAQAAAIHSGRHKHPTKGKQRSEHTRNKISESLYKTWLSLSQEEKDKRVQLGQRQWANMREDDKIRLRRLAAEAMRETANKGSKLERYLLIELRRNNYQVRFHATHQLTNEKLHIDLFIPNLKIAVEVDGPAHFLPIWGQENLAKHLSSDNMKTGLLLADGFVVIRVKNLLRNSSKIKYRHLLTRLLDLLKCISQEFPTSDSRFIELEL